MMGKMGLTTQPESPSDRCEVKDNPRFFDLSASHPSHFTHQPIHSWRDIS